MNSPYDWHPHSPPYQTGHKVREVHPRLDDVRVAHADAFAESRNSTRHGSCRVHSEVVHRNPMLLEARAVPIAPAEADHFVADTRRRMSCKPVEQGFGAA